MAATQGVYSRLNTSKDAAANGVSTVAILLPNNTSRVATTLSFAINPLIKDVAIRLNGQHQGQWQEQDQHLFLSQEQDLMQMLLLLLGLDS